MANTHIISLIVDFQSGKERVLISPLPWPLHCCIHTQSRTSVWYILFCFRSTTYACTYIGRIKNYFCFSGHKAFSIWVRNFNFCLIEFVGYLRYICFLNHFGPRIPRTKSYSDRFILLQASNPTNSKLIGTNIPLNSSYLCQKLRYLPSLKALEIGFNQRS